MKDNIPAHLKYGRALVSDHYIVRRDKFLHPDAIVQSLNAYNFEDIYRHWLKDNKVYSEERMAVYHDHLSLFLSRYRVEATEP